jgi:hypothetical protein
MTPEEAMDRRDALAERAVAEMVQLPRSEARDLISDLLLAEVELTHAVHRRIQARAALRT